MIFLIGYDRSLGKLDVFETLRDDQAELASKKRLKLELANAENPEYEALVLESADEATLKKTHARLFLTVRELAERQESLTE